MHDVRGGRAGHLGLPEPSPDAPTISGLRSSLSAGSSPPPAVRLEASLQPGQLRLRHFDDVSETIESSNLCYADGTTVTQLLPGGTQRVSGEGLIMDPSGQLRELVHFADEIGLFYDDLGLPRSWGRVLGWLLVCEPDYQSADDLADGLHASRGSISMATRSLIRMGYVERQTKRGDRRTYYRIRPGTWITVFEQLIQTTTKLRQLAKLGLGLLNDEPAPRRDRLQELHDFTTFYENGCLALIAQWHRNEGQEL